MASDRKPLIYLAIALLAGLYIIISGPLFVKNIPFLLTQIFGLLLIVWAGLAIKMNKHTGEPHNLPKGYFFVTKGPYEIIRHPIYAGIILVMAGAVQGDFSVWRFLAFFVLFCTTLLKLTHDENFMTHHVKDFAHFKEKTHRIIPYFY